MGIVKRNNEEFGAYLQDLRLSCKMPNTGKPMTRTELAEELNAAGFRTTRSDIRAYELGHRMMAADRFIAITRILNCTAREMKVLRELAEPDLRRAQINK